MEYSQQQRRKQRYKKNSSIMEEIDVHKKIEKEKQDELNSLHSEMNELLDMMDDMKGMAADQRIQIDLIEDNVNRANKNVEKGRKEIHSAKKYQAVGMKSFLSWGSKKLFR